MNDGETKGFGDFPHIEASFEDAFAEAYDNLRDLRAADTLPAPPDDDEPEPEEETVIRSRRNGLGQRVELKQQGNAYKTYVNGAQQGVSVYFRYALETFDSHANKDSDGY